MKMQFKRVKAVVLAVCMLVGMFGGMTLRHETVYAMTTQSVAVSWARNQVGSQYNEGFGVQCVALISKYCDYLGVPHIYGHAYQFTTSAIPSGWSRIKGAAVQPGDIAIWEQNPPYSSHGHVVIVLSSNGNSFEVIDQNGSGNQDPGTIRTKTYGDNYWGVIRPNFNPEHDPPTVSEGQVIGVDAGGYMLQCKVIGSTVSSVKVASWVDGNGQGDLKWSDMVRQADGVTYKCYIAYSEHENIVGNYQNHIYAYNSAGEGVRSVYFSVGDKPEISDLHIADADSGGYTIECKIDSYNMLSVVQVATWITSDGQDDLQWENLECQPDGLTYRCYVPYSSHNYEKGSYENLVCAKSITGEDSQMITHCNELHNWNAGSVLREAGCDETGLKEYTCTACNETKREEIPAAHNEDSGTVTKQPTETEAGIRTYKCSICQRELRTEEIAKLPPAHTHDYGTTAWKSDAEKHWKECECGEKAEEAAHGFAWIIDTAATEENTGIKHEECGKCRYKRNVGTVIEKLPPTTPKPSESVKPSESIKPSEEPSATPNAGVKPNESSKSSEEPSASTKPSTAPGTLGDVNSDGKLNLSDAQICLKAALNLTILSPEQLKYADVNINGSIDLQDAQMILKAALNLIVLTNDTGTERLPIQNLSILRLK